MRHALLHRALLNLSEDNMDKVCKNIDEQGFIEVCKQAKVETRASKAVFQRCAAPAIT